MASAVSANCRLTILDLSHTGFQVIQRQVADLIFETVEIHVGILCIANWEKEDDSVVESWFRRPVRSTLATPNQDADSLNSMRTQRAVEMLIHIFIHGYSVRNYTLSNSNFFVEDNRWGELPSIFRVPRRILN